MASPSDESAAVPDEEPPQYSPPQGQARETSAPPEKQHANAELEAPSIPAEPQASSSAPASYTKPIVLELQRKKPKYSSSSPKAYIAGDAFLTTRDAFLLSSTITYTAMFDVLLKRMRERRLFPLKGERDETSNLYWQLYMRASGKPLAEAVLLDKGSWEAGREFVLTREDAVLTFALIVVQKEEEVKAKEGVVESQKTEKGKCMVQ